MKRGTVTYDIAQAALADEARHPGVVMRLFAHQHGLTVLDQVEQVSAQTFTFEIEADGPRIPEQFPSYMTARPHR